jgi:hypothetical protein
MSDETWDGGDEDYDDEDDSYDYSEELDEDDFGVCDHDGCNVTYQVADSAHCGVEGTCWPHCANRAGHDPLYSHLLDQFVEEHA